MISTRGQTIVNRTEQIFVSLLTITMVDRVETITEQFHHKTDLALVSREEDRHGQVEIHSALHPMVFDHLRAAIRSIDNEGSTGGGLHGSRVRCLSEEFLLFTILAQLHHNAF